MFCSKCGLSLGKDSEFCSKCGTAVATKRVAAPTPKNKDTTDSNSKTVKPKPTKSSRVGTVLTYIVTGLVALVFVAALFSMGESEDNADPPQGNSSSPETSSSSTSGTVAVTESGVEVTVQSIDTSPEVPNNFVIDPSDVKGQLVSVRFLVANGSNEEISISNGSVFGYIQEAEYSAEAIFSENGDWYVFETLGPGLSVVFDVFFDVPVGGELTGALFTTSIFLGEELKFTFR